MRAAILILIVVIVGVIAAIATGFLNISQIRGARAPQVSATSNGVTAQGGQAPAFEVETGSVRIGAAETNVTIPAVEVSPARGEAQQQSNGQAASFGGSNERGEASNDAGWSRGPAVRASRGLLDEYA